MIRDQDPPGSTNPVCPLPEAPDLSGVIKIELNPLPPLGDYLAAMRLADTEAEKRLGDYMLLSWYDRDRDFESPQHATENLRCEVFQPDFHSDRV